MNKMKAMKVQFMSTLKKHENHRVMQIRKERI